MSFVFKLFAIIIDNFFNDMNVNGVKIIYSTTAAL